jgi:hypothetical protein
MMIACPECAQPVSDQAPACLKCGHPINSWVHAAKQWITRTFFGDRTEGVVFLMAACFVLSVVSVPVPMNWVWGIAWIPIWALQGQPVIWPLVLLEWLLIGGLGGWWIVWLRRRAPKDAS